jgi:hypothetical protein
MKNPLLWLAALIALGGGFAAYWHFRADAPADIPAPPVAAAPSSPAPAPAAPRIEHPVTAPVPGAPPLPPLADSDRTADALIVALFGRDAYARIFVSDDVIRRFVATIDNLPRKTAAQRLMPVRPVPGPFVAKGDGDAFTTVPDNALRYRPYMLVVDQADPKRLVAEYIRLYPLFQAAYQELGYPNGYFNDRLVQTIDDLLAAPEVAAPALVQPKVLYRYADTSLEDLSAGQKIMVRIGPANEARVKDKLRAIRRELTGPQAPH